MKHNLLKTLLVSALALGAWGGVSADEITATLVHTASTSCDGSKVTTNTMDSEKEHFNAFSNSNIWEGYAFAEFSFTIPDGQIVKSATLTWTSLQGGSKTRNNTVAYLSPGTTIDYETFTSIKTSNTCKYVSSRTEITTVTTAGGKTTTFNTDVTNSVKAVVDGKQSYVIYQWSNNMGGADLYGKGSSDKAPTLIITTEDASSTANYTVSYYNQTKEEVIKTEQYTGSIGSAPELDAKLKANFFNDEKSVKYIYVSDDADDKTVNKDGSTVVTVTFREANTYSYTVKSDIDGFSATGIGLEGETVTVPFPYYLLKDGTIYKTSKLGDKNMECNKTIVLDENNKVETLNYTATDITDVIYFSEAEDIPGMTVINTGNSAIRSSRSASGYAKDGDVKICTLVPGKYKITSVAYDGAGKNPSAVFNYKMGENVIFTQTAASINWDQQTSEEFEVTKISNLMLGQTSNSKQGIDVLYIIKTGDVETETATITDAGFATYVPSNNVVVPSENVTVYTAKVADNKVNLTAVEAGTVLEANQGYVIAGAAGDHSFTVTEDAAATLDNDLKAAIADVTADGTQYVLAKQDTNVGFSKVEENTTIAAGKAYLVVNSADQTSAKAFLAIGGGTTGVEAIEAATADNDVYYSISGVKTTKPAKGLYIHNGKKVIVK